MEYADIQGRQALRDGMQRLRHDLGLQDYRKWREAMKEADSHHIGFAEYLLEKIKGIPLAQNHPFLRDLHNHKSLLFRLVYSSSCNITAAGNARAHPQITASVMSDYISTLEYGSREWKDMTALCNYLFST